MNIATETYIKEALSNFFQLISSNGASYIRTADFKKKADREERRVERGELQRVAAGELPVEAEERRKRPAMCMEDLRLALLLGDGYLGQVPLISGSISNSRFLDTPGVEDVYDLPPYIPSKAAATLPNGLPAANGINGVAVPDPLANQAADQTWNIDLGDPMVLDDDLTWHGGSVKDVDDMDTALESVLELGNL